MQQCTFCGAYLVEKSLTCSRCGCEQIPIARLTPFEEGTAGGDVSTAQEHVNAGFVQGTQQKSHQFQPYHHSYFLPQQPVQRYVRQEVPVQQHRERRTASASTGGKSAMLKWMMVAAIAVLVIAGGVGVFALIPRTPSPSPGKVNVATRTFSGSNVTQIPAGSTPTTNTHTVNASKSTTTTLTCSESGSHTGAFTFTGVVAGSISLSTFQACNSAGNACYITCFYASTSKSGSHTYFGKAQGKIAGVTYEFEFLINPYSGPGTYTSAGSTNVVLMRDNYEWESYGTTSNHTSIVVNANGKTGSIRATISMMSPEFDPTNMVIVTGNWSQ
jgi:hypothetical protein